MTSARLRATTYFAGFSDTSSALKCALLFWTSFTRFHQAYRYVFEPGRDAIVTEEGGRQREIYQAADRGQAMARFRRWCKDWGATQPRAVACLERDLEELLNFLDCPESHRIKVRTTNAMERSFREVRRRTRPMSCFQNGKSVERIVYGVISHLNIGFHHVKELKFVAEMQALGFYAEQIKTLLTIKMSNEGVAAKGEAITAVFEQHRKYVEDKARHFDRMRERLLANAASFVDDVLTDD